MLNSFDYYIRMKKNFNTVDDLVITISNHMSDEPIFEYILRGFPERIPIKRISFQEALERVGVIKVEEKDSIKLIGRFEVNGIYSEDGWELNIY